jgi:hypothetical protein
MSNNPKFNDWQKKFPNLFKEYPRSGFYLSKGWEVLVGTLCNILESTIVTLPQELRDEVYCVQVKEKFGGLRFYMNKETPYISGAIDMAENMSYRICETCGKAGERRGGSYIQVLCNKHFKDKEKK